MTWLTPQDDCATAAEALARAKRVKRLAWKAHAPVERKRREPPPLEIPPSVAHTVRDIGLMAAQLCGVRFDELYNMQQRSGKVRYRQVVDYLARRHSGKSFPKIGTALRGRNHTTVMYSCRKIEKLLAAGDPQVVRIVESLERWIESGEVPPLPAPTRRKDGPTKWMRGELAYLKELLAGGRFSIDEIAFRLGRSYNSVNAKADHLGLGRKVVT